MIDPASPNLPTYLREALGGGSTMVSIGATFARMLADAIEIADSCARSDIECNLPRYESDHALAPVGYYATDLADPADQVWLPQVLRYLYARSLIEHHPDQPDLIRFVKAPA